MPPAALTPTRRGLFENVADGLEDHLEVGVATRLLDAANLVVDLRVVATARSSRQ
jgi:hypothetical protein